MMRGKGLVVLVVALFSTLGLVAQEKATLRGKIIEHDTKEPLSMVVVEVISKRDTTQRDAIYSDKEGVFEKGGLVFGEYQIRTLLTGYAPVIKEVMVDSIHVDVGVLSLAVSSHDLKEAVVERIMMRTSQHGDTLSYNAEAFKVSQDADAEDLLAKMPGIKVQNGKVEAQGESVKKVFVDGKEFFGSDVATTIKTLPAEVISRIEVFNRLSDQAEFSGVDDGEGYKAINIVTKIKTAKFGKIYGGYAFDKLYSAGANINIFRDKNRVSFTGLVNNLGQRNFSEDDILGGSEDLTGGLTTIQSFGVNYGGEWGKKWKATADYQFNNSDNERIQDIEREYFSSDRQEVEKYVVNRDNMSHRFNARLDYAINDNHRLMIRPVVSFQGTDNVSDRDMVAEDATGSFIDKLVRQTTDDNWGYRVANTVVYRVKLGKSGRNINVTAQGNFNRNDRDRLNIKDEEDAVGVMKKSGEKTNNDSDSWGASGRFMYSEPLTKHAQLTMQYRVNYSYSDQEKLQYAWDPTLNEYSDDLDTKYSNVYNSGYLTQTIGPGFSYNKEKNRIVANISYQHASLTSEQEYPTANALAHRFNNITYFAMINKSFVTPTVTNTIRVFTRSATSNPSVTQLQNVVDITNTRRVSSGNPDLKPYYNNMLNMSYIRSNTEKGNTFMLFSDFALRANDISNALTIMEADTMFLLPNGETLAMKKDSQYSRPVNMSGYWSVGGGLSYGFPVRWLKSNLNLNLDARYNESPSYLNDLKNILGTQSYGGGLTLGSNISEKIDFTIGYSASYNITNNSIRKDINTEYFYHTANMRFKWVAWAGFTLSGNVAFLQNLGISDDVNDHSVVCNLFIGKKLFKKQNGEILVGAYDMFNQQNSFNRAITSRYSQISYTNVLGRYFGFQFVYQLRNYGTKQTSTPSSGEKRERYDSPPGGGAPGGGSSGGGGAGRAAMVVM